jgi:hypothetical protein
MRMLLILSVSICQEYQHIKHAKLFIRSSIYCRFLKIWNMIDLSKLLNFYEAIFRKMENSNMETAHNLLT